MSSRSSNLVSLMRSRSCWVEKALFRRKIIEDFYAARLRIVDIGFTISAFGSSHGCKNTIKGRRRSWQVRSWHRATDSGSGQRNPALIISTPRPAASLNRKQPSSPYHTLLIAHIHSTCNFVFPRDIASDPQFFYLFVSLFEAPWRWENDAANV